MSNHSLCLTLCHPVVETGDLSPTTFMVPSETLVEVVVTGKWGRDKGSGRPRKSIRRGRTGRNSVCDRRPKGGYGKKGGQLLQTWVCGPSLEPWDGRTSPTESTHLKEPKTPGSPLRSGTDVGVRPSPPFTRVPGVATRPTIREFSENNFGQFPETRRRLLSANSRRPILMSPPLSVRQRPPNLVSRPRRKESRLDRRPLRSSGPHPRPSFVLVMF